MNNFKEFFKGYSEADSNEGKTPRYIINVWYEKGEKAGSHAAYSAETMTEVYAIIANLDEYDKYAVTDTHTNVDIVTHGYDYDADVFYDSIKDSDEPGAGITRTYKKAK